VKVKHAFTGLIAVLASASRQENSEAKAKALADAAEEKSFRADTTATRDSDAKYLVGQARLHPGGALGVRVGRNRTPRLHHRCPVATYPRASHPLTGAIRQR